MAKRKKKKAASPAPRRRRHPGICRQAEAKKSLPGFLSDGDDKTQSDIILIDAEGNEIRVTARDVLLLIRSAQAIKTAAEESLEPFVLLKKAGG